MNNQLRFYNEKFWASLVISINSVIAVFDTSLLTKTFLPICRLLYRIISNLSASSLNIIEFVEKKVS